MLVMNCGNENLRADDGVVSVGVVLEEQVLGLGLLYLQMAKGKHRAAQSVRHKCRSGTPPDQPPRHQGTQLMGGMVTRKAFMAS